MSLTDTLVERFRLDLGSRDLDELIGHLQRARAFLGGFEIGIKQYPSLHFSELPREVALSIDDISGSIEEAVGAIDATLQAAYTVLGEREADTRAETPKVL